MMEQSSGVKPSWTWDLKDRSILQWWSHHTSLQPSTVSDTAHDSTCGNFYFRPPCRWGENKKSPLSTSPGSLYSFKDISSFKAKLSPKSNQSFIWDWIWVKPSCESIITAKEALLRFTVVLVLGTLILNGTARGTTRYFCNTKKARHNMKLSLKVPLSS